MRKNDRILLTCACIKNISNAKLPLFWINIGRFCVPLDILHSFGISIAQFLSLKKCCRGDRWFRFSHVVLRGLKQENVKRIFRCLYTTFKHKWF